MPIYEYRCQGCGHLFSKLRSLNATDEDVTCPQCGSGPAERLLSTFASAGSQSAGSPPSSGGSCGPFT